MSVSASSSRYRKAPLDLLLKPRDGEVYVDRWWMLDAEGDPVFFTDGRSSASPQCNKDKRIFSTLRCPPGCEPGFLPLVFLGHRDDEGGWRWLASQLEPLAADGE